MSENRHREAGGAVGKALLLLAIWGAGAMLMGLFWVKDSDLTAARQEVLRENSPPPENTASVAPEVFRRNFEFGQPVPGQKGKYQWKVRGQESSPVDANTDKILGFKGEIDDRGNLIEVSSRVALFDRQERVVISKDGVVLQMDWARIEAPEMVMQMKTHDTVFSGGVTTEIDREEATKRQEAAPSPSGQNPPSEKPADTKDTEEKKKKRTPLVITSRELQLLKDKNLAIFTGDVVAKDESGIICADRMEAYNYSEEEQKKDPKLKGVKTVICIGNVKIDQVGKKQAVCARAEYDAKANMIHLYRDPKTGKKVVYRDEEQKFQAKALEMILDRNKNEVTFTGPGGQGEVETIDFNPDRKSFLGFMETEKPQAESGAGKSPKAPQK